jgi:hypothetical protein
MISVVIGVVCLAAGIGLGRIKNAQKLAAARVELNKIEAGVSTEAKAIVARIRALL